MDPDSGTGHEITGLLVEWRQGDPTAVSRLFPLVYSELRALAHRMLARGPGFDRSLETGGLVHEAYVKLVDQSRAEIQDRGHFFAVASRAMRHILVDRARARCAMKRGGGEEAVADADVLGAPDRADQVLSIDLALGKLEAVDRRLAEVVEMRFFGGLSEAETAAALAVSERTVRRDWQKARAFLVLELSADSP